MIAHIDGCQYLPNDLFCTGLYFWSLPREGKTLKAIANYFTDMDALLLKFATTVASEGSLRGFCVEEGRSIRIGRGLKNSLENHWINFLKLYPADNCLLLKPQRTLLWPSGWGVWVLRSVIVMLLLKWVLNEWHSGQHTVTLNVPRVLLFSSKQTSCKLQYKALLYKLLPLSGVLLANPGVLLPWIWSICWSGEEGPL